MTALLETRALTMRFGGVVAVDHVDFDPERGRAALPDRPERRGQEHLLQVPDRPAPADGGPGACSAGSDVTGLDPFAIARLGIGIKTQVP